MTKKVLCGLLLFVFIFSATNVNSMTYASDLLTVIPGSFSSGRLIINFIDSFDASSELFYDEEVIYSVEEILEMPDVDDKLVRFRRKVTFLTTFSSDYSTGMISETDYLIWQHNRTVAVPLVNFKIINGSTVVESSLLSEDTFGDISYLNNTIITLSDGRIFNWDEIQSISSLSQEDLTLIDGIRNSWIRHYQLADKVRDCISPDVSIGELIDYGWFEGEVSALSQISIGDDQLDVFNVHFNYTESPSYSLPGHSSVRTVMPDSDYYYESKTGLTAGFIHYNTSEFPFSAIFTVNEIYIATLTTEPEINTTLSLHYEYLFSILGLSCIVCFVYLFKK